MLSTKRYLRGLVSGILFGLVPAIASAQVVFHGIGDLPGGPVASSIRDATRVGGVIYAVGGSAANNQVLCVSPNNPVGCVTFYTWDTPAMWTWDGTTGTLTALPNLLSNATGVNAMSMVAITPDAAYIAGQARIATFPNGSFSAVRITRSSLPNSSADLNLTTSPFPVYTFINNAGSAVTSNTNALTISTDGTILYGGAVLGDQRNGTLNFRAIRFDIPNQTSSVIPLLPDTTSGNQVTFGGASSDGSVMVGVSFTAPYAGSTNGRAFRYVHGTGVSAIPLIVGGTWNKPLSLTPDGNITVVAGNSTGFANGEIYLYNAALNTTTTLGSPNEAWIPTTLGGITSDGSVLAVTFAAPDNSERFTYIHNSHGWFQLLSVLAGGGIDITSAGWENFQIGNVSADGTLVVGNGVHNGNTEGFVAEFPAGYLASFSSPPVTPLADAVGAWYIIDPDNHPGLFIVLPDGAYYLLDWTQPDGSSNGYDRGRVYWNNQTGALSFVTLQSTMGSVGVSGLNGYSGITLGISGDTLTLRISSPGEPDFIASGNRIKGPANSIVGAWYMGNANIDNSSAVLVLTNDGTYYFAQDGDADSSNGHTGSPDGIEKGTYVWNPTTNAFAGTNKVVDTNGSNGLASNLILHFSPDGLSIGIVENSVEEFTGHRVVDAATLNPVSLRGDFNGDGKSDIILQNTDGSTTIWLMDGLTVIGGGGLLGPGSPWRAVQVGDLNGDGKSDIVWQNIDGSAAIWLMNGVSAISGGSLIGPGTGWSVVQVGDFNGDGKSDIVWQNIDGSAAIWLMNGVSALSGGGLIGPGTGWSVNHVGDFNGDGKSDIVWQNTDGGAAIWLMNGVSALSGGGLIGPGTGWSVKHVGDFNGDGKSDVVWQNTDGSAAIWLMNGVSALSGGGLIGPGTGWSVVQVGDLDGDLKSDIVWENIDGSAAVWLMNGLGVSGGAGLIGPGTGWSVRTTADFNGDSKRDIVWQNTDGSSAIWLMNGLSAISGGSLLGPGTGWSPAP